MKSASIFLIVICITFLASCSYNERLAQFQADYAEAERYNRELENDNAHKEIVIRNQRNELIDSFDREREARNQLMNLRAIIGQQGQELERLKAERHERIKRIRSYTVIKGDCLWLIAKKPSIYNNPWRWPLIYRANRDQIINPDLIYPAQIFRIPK